ncbi:Uncharacterised protein [Elizabethkingia meningoseptica]|nr:Uncharacterised protein [Elizabethkingia meningoseptica]
MSITRQYSMVNFSELVYSYQFTVDSLELPGDG